MSKFKRYLNNFKLTVIVSFIAWVSVIGCCAILMGCAQHHYIYITYEDRPDESDI